MSDFSAIAGVSRTLRTLLTNQMDNPATITVAPPDISVAGVNGRRVNLYLYEVRENATLKNQEIPGHGHPSVFGRPPLSLDLHYLLTAYGDSETAADADLVAQQLLGDAMRVLHDFALWPADLPGLDPSLQREYERIKVTLRPASLEELSKIWTAMPQSNFRRSVVYDISVVQIESQARRRLAKPVEIRRLELTLAQRPEIKTAYRKPTTPGAIIGDPRVGIAETLVIEGAHFDAMRTWVRLGGLEPIRVTPLANEMIEIPLPDAQYPADADHPLQRPIPSHLLLQPGAQLIEVLTEHPTEAVEGGLGRGVPPTSATNKTLVSNQAVFMLIPKLTGTAPVSATPSDLLTLTGDRLFRAGLVSFVVLGEHAIQVRQPALGDPWAEPTDTSVQIPLTALATPPPGGQLYAVRIQVNGAQNRETTFSFTLTP